jgi:acyl-CoA thioesterase
VPASSLTWSLEFVEPPEKITGEWFYLEFVVEAAADGYTQQSGKIYDELGRLVALTRQCMVYFG